MSSLVEELGPAYIRDFFHNATFVMGDRLHRLVDVNDEQLTTQSIDLSSKTPPVRWGSGPTVLSSEVKNFSTFRHPKLGYRQIDSKTFGKFVVHLSSHRSTQRGFRPEVCSISWLPVYDLFPDYSRCWSEIPHCHQAKEIYVPTFTPFAEGVQHLLAGDWVGFAMNEDVAIGLSVHSDQNRGFDIYFRGRVVGNVGLDGKANISSSILKRDSIKAKMFK